MKKKLVLFVLIEITSGSCMAAGAGSGLLKTLGKAEVGGIHAAPLTKMSRAGLESNQDMKAAISKADDGNWFTWGDVKSGLFTPRNNGQSGVIQTLKNNSDGSVERTAFNIPESITTPSKTTITTVQAEGAGVYREFQMNSGLIKVSQVYDVKVVDSTPLRVQRSYTINTGSLDGSVSTIGGSLYINMRNTSGMRSHVALDQNFLGGQPIGYKLSSNGSVLTVQVSAGSTIQEISYSLTNTGVMQPRIIDGVNKGNMNNLEVQQVAFKKLTQKEIRALGLLGELKIYKGRQTVSEPVRGMTVTGAVQ